MSTSERITEAALQLFYRQGFHASGVEQLSQAAGVTKKTLYRHFPGKEQLVEAALRRRDAQFMAKLQAALEPLAAQQRPLGYIDFIEAWAGEPDFHGCAFINAAAEYAAAEDPAHALAHAHKRQLLSYLESVCTGAGLPAAAAQPLLLVGEGLIVSCQVMGLEASRVEAARALVRGLGVSR